MIILSHRGDWRSAEDKNSIAALQRSFVNGFGTETDIRDRAGELVISHDPPVGNALLVAELFQCYRELDSSLTLALNIKSDGLQQRLADLIKEYGIDNYFVFDMSVPDALGYLRLELNAYTRHSEFEKTCSFYDQAVGVWMDMFERDWIDPSAIRRHLDDGKQVCLVSPDLHKRDHLQFWDMLRQSDIVDSDQLMLCTDHPHDAARHFGG